MDRWTVIRVEMEGLTTSFRYPFFSQGVHPTLPVPPPATVFGHLCSAYGEPFDNTVLSFGYTFTHRGEFIDLEHLWFADTMNPARRHMLFEPRLTLYISAPDLDLLYSAFRSPYYPVILGRSQDLMTYTSIEIVELVAAEQAYFEGTLLPPMYAPAVDGSTLTMTLARFIDERRVPDWDDYAVLRGRALYPAEPLPPGAPDSVWVDPQIREHPAYPELARGVWLHPFSGEKYRNAVPH